MSPEPFSSNHRRLPLLNVPGYNSKSLVKKGVDALKEVKEKFHFFFSDKALVSHYVAILDLSADYRG